MRMREEAATHCAAKILELLEGALEESPRATLAISGGSTPKLMFEDMAKARFDWARVHLFWVDERGVPPTDPQSNYKLAKEAWLDPAHFPSGNVHRIQAEREPELAARLYATEIREFFQLAPGEMPGFDVDSSRHGSGCAYGQSVSRPAADRRSQGSGGGGVCGEVSAMANHAAAWAFCAPPSRP